MDQPVKIGIVAGEASGDLLGADLINHLRGRFPDAIFTGLGGDNMIASGLQSLFEMDRLSVMGIVEPLKRLPELLHIRKALYRHFLSWGADLVIGIDSPDFNLGLEEKLRRNGVLTAHYVSPSVWAWRQGRVRKIARAVDRMITLFPFETEFYRQHRVSVSFVGHPLADRIPLDTDTAAARSELGLEASMCLAVMPGSRGAEIKHMCDMFLQVCHRLQGENPRLQFVIPSANSTRHDEISQILKGYPDLHLTLVRGNSHRVMAASDAVLLTSGTTALEAMLLNKPMVVAYRMGAVSHWLLSRLIHSQYISIPNLLAGKALVPELVQGEASLGNLVNETRAILYDRDQRENLKSAFRELHESLRLGAGETAARVLAQMITDRRARSAS